MAKKVVIIGGGFAGSMLARRLERKFDVTLIDCKNYFEFTPGILRTVVEYDHLRKIQLLHSAYLRKAEIIIGHVDSVDKGHVIVNGVNIEYDYLAICAGSKYYSPFKEQDIVMATRGQHLKDSCKKLIGAKNVLIVGGGLVGVELAAEIADKFKDKKITLVHSQDNLMERTPKKAREYAYGYLKNKGIEIIVNEAIKNKEDGHFITDKGKKINPDIAFLCTGIVPNYEFLKNKFSKALSKSNRVVINDFLQVKGQERVFAAGDLTEIQEEKTAQNAERQARVVAKNIIALERGSQMAKYKSLKTPLVISLGKYNGLFVWDKFVLKGIIPAFLKWFIEKREMFKLKYLH